MFWKMKMKIHILMLLLQLIFTVLPKVQTTSNKMMNQTFAQIRMLSYQLPDQPRADRAMHHLLCTNIKLTRKVLTRNVIKTIMDKNVGTNDVEKYVKNVCMTYVYFVIGTELCVICSYFV